MELQLSAFGLDLGAYLVPLPNPQVGKPRPGVRAERNVRAWGLAGQDLTGSGCCLFEQRPLSKCAGGRADPVWVTERSGSARLNFRFGSDIDEFVSLGEDLSFFGP